MNRSSSPATTNHSHGLNPAEFQIAVESAEELTRLLRSDYPSTKPSLVIAIKGEYVGCETSVIVKLEKAPRIFIDNPSKRAVQKHLQTTPPSELHRKENESRLKQWEKAHKKRLTELSDGLRFKSEALFEIRFGNLHHEEIWRMQTDPRVDPTRTPQTKASIKIVIGSLAEILSALPPKE